MKRWTTECAAALSEALRNPENAAPIAEAVGDVADVAGRSRSVDEFQYLANEKLVERCLEAWAQVVRNVRREHPSPADVAQALAYIERRRGEPWIAKLDKHQRDRVFAAMDEAAEVTRQQGRGD